MYDSTSVSRACSNILRAPSRAKRSSADTSRSASSPCLFSTTLNIGVPFLALPGAEWVVGSTSKGTPLFQLTPIHNFWSYLGAVAVTLDEATAASTRPPFITADMTPRQTGTKPSSCGPICERSRTKERDQRTSGHTNKKYQDISRDKRLRVGRSNSPSLHRSHNRVDQFAKLAHPKP